MNNTKYIIVLFAAVLLSACANERITDMDSFYGYLNNPDHDLCIIKEANGVQLKAKYLPPEYLAYKDYMNEGRIHNLDSIIEFYSHQVTIMLSIDPVSTENNDIMTKDIGGYKNFKERLYSLNFDIEQNVELKTDDNNYKPVLSSFERMYGLKPGRDILFVFSPESKTDKALFDGKTLVFEFDDRNFGTGISRFKFKRKAINKLNAFNLKQVLEQPLNQTAKN